MDDDDTYDSDHDQTGYQPVSEIDPSALREALCRLHLLGDDPFLRMQATNLAMIDQFVSQLESGVFQKLITEDGTPLEAVFLSAQSQMWLFAAYELLRTWRQRGSDIVNWHENGGLELKLKALEKKDGYQHIGRACRATQIKSVLGDPSLIGKIKDDQRRAHILFRKLEAIRVSLAKHELPGRTKSVAFTPGYGRINQSCGSIDFELESGQFSMGYINRRDIADGIRAFLLEEALPTDDDIASFEEFLRGPPQQ